MDQKDKNTEASRPSGDAYGESDFFDPRLARKEKMRGAHIGDQHIRVKRSEDFTSVSPGFFQATAKAVTPRDWIGRARYRLKGILIGAPLTTERESHERLTKLKALAVFGSDAISSCAYATEETLLVLVVAGNAALGISFFTALAVAILLSIIAFSYRQTIHAYPQGGGSYSVSRENLGQLAGLVAAAALLIDYVLTVSVSIAAGAAAVTSAIIASGFAQQIDALEHALPPNLNFNVLLSLFFVGLITLGNLRGIREAGSIFAIPTYLFIGSLTLMIGIGLFKTFTGTLAPVEAPPLLKIAEPVSYWLILRAFSAGAVAMSGTEAISNGVPAFQKPESKNAAATLTVMATLLSAFFLGISFLATHMGLAPGEETIMSQIARAVFGTGWLYYIFQIATMGILVIAANTAFADFPRLGSILARDDYAPHQFAYRGDRLAFSTGILALGVIGALLIVLFAGDVSRLIHLYAVGVFLAFTMSNAGMVVHWWKTRGENWQTSILVNGVGAVLTFIVLVIVAVTKFALGAWIIIIAIPLIVGVFLFIHQHYARVDAALVRRAARRVPTKLKIRVLVILPAVNYATERALAFARSISPNIAAVTVTFDRATGERVHRELQALDPAIPHIVLEDPYRDFYEPLKRYVETLQARDADAYITIVIPEFLVRHWWERLLHNTAAQTLNRLFQKHENVAVVNVPFQL
ncbi:MAG: APC family permease [Chloroflexi bacterium]|nr:APC family permease [Chloroflexota bacterium]